MYAAVLRELDMPLHFPGSEARWVGLMEATDATLLTNAIAFIACEPRAANQAINVTNGDVFRWEHAWPRIAAHFGMRTGDIRPMNLETFMRDKDAVWQRVVRRWGLTPSRLDNVAAWAYGDFVFGIDHDIMSSTTRLRQAGFHDVIDSEAMFLHQLRQYRDAKILP